MVTGVTLLDWVTCETEDSEEEGVLGAEEDISGEESRVIVQLVRICFFVILVN